MSTQAAPDWWEQESDVVSRNLPQKWDPHESVTGYISRLYADRLDPACRPRYLRVIIHPSTAHLRAAAQRYTKGVVFPDAEGIFHPLPLRSAYNRHTRTWEDTTGAMAGIIRVARDTVTPEVAAHECVHAGLHIMRLHDWSKVRGLGEACLEDMATQEEPFAYLVGALVPLVHTMVSAALH